MKDLLEAFQIFNKYIPNEKYPTQCAHDEMYVACDPAQVSDADKARLNELGFFASTSGGVNCFKSFRFGSA